MGGRYRFVVTFATPKMQIDNRHLVADISGGMDAPVNLHQRSAFATFATEHCYFGSDDNEMTDGS